MVKLSKRLAAVAKLVTPGKRICDVGTDHGYIPLFLVENNIVPYAYAMDVNVGPLLKAKEHIAREKMDKYIETRLSDGLKSLNIGEVETIIIAGMGGGLVMRILEEGRNKTEAVEELILQPQSDVEQVRRYLCEHGFRIVEEDIVLEDGKYYFPIRCIPSSALKSAGSISHDRYGEHLIRKNHPLLQSFLDKEERQLSAIRKNLGHQRDSEAARLRTQEIEERIFVIADTRKEMAQGCNAEKS